MEAQESNQVPLSYQQSHEAKGDSAEDIHEVGLHQQLSSKCSGDTCPNCDIVDSYQEDAKQRPAQIVDGNTETRSSVFGKSISGPRVENSSNQTLDVNNREYSQEDRGSCSGTISPSSSSHNTQEARSSTIGRGPHDMQNKVKDLGSQEYVALLSPLEYGAGAVEIEGIGKGPEKGRYQFGDASAQLRDSIIRCKGLDESLKSTKFSGENGVKAEIQQGASTSEPISSRLQPLNHCCNHKIQELSAVVEKLTVTNQKVLEIWNQNCKSKTGIPSIETAQFFAIDRIEMLRYKIMQVFDETQSSRRVIEEPYILPLGKKREAYANDRGQTDQRSKIARKDTQEEYPILIGNSLGRSGKYPKRLSGTKGVRRKNTPSTNPKRRPQTPPRDGRGLIQRPVKIVKRDLGFEHPDDTELLGEWTTLCQGLVPNLSGIFRSGKDLSYAHVLEKFDTTKARIMLIGLYQRVVSEERIYKLGWWYVLIVVLIWHLHALRYCLHLP